MFTIFLAIFIFLVRFDVVDVIRNIHPVTLFHKFSERPAKTCLLTFVIRLITYQLHYGYEQWPRGDDQNALL